MTEITSWIHDEMRNRNVSLMRAADFGSQARGTHNEDSDYDVMAVYHHPMSEYVKPGSPRQTIDLSNEALDVDLMAWDTKKFGGHYTESNPTAIEFLLSDEVYYCEEGLTEWFDRLLDVARDDFKPLALYMHYRSMAKSNYLKYVASTYHDGEGNTYLESTQVGDSLDDGMFHTGTTNWGYPDLDNLEQGTTTPTAKKNLFALRAAMLARYIREIHEIPPLDFDEFCVLYRRKFGGSSHLSWATELAFQKRKGYGDDIVGNVAKRFIEKECWRDIDHSRHVTDGIDESVYGEFTEFIYEP